jgi:hypothetical protein
MHPLQLDQSAEAGICSRRSCTKILNRGVLDTETLRPIILEIHHYYYINPSISSVSSSAVELSGDKSLSRGVELPCSDMQITPQHQIFEAESAPAVPMATKPFYSFI